MSSVRRSVIGRRLVGFFVAPAVVAGLLAGVPTPVEAAEQGRPTAPSTKLVPIDRVKLRQAKKSDPSDTSVRPKSPTWPKAGSTSVVTDPDEPTDAGQGLTVATAETAVPVEAEVLGRDETPAGMGAVYALTIGQPVAVEPDPEASPSPSPSASPDQQESPSPEVSPSPEADGSTPRVLSRIEGDPDTDTESEGVEDAPVDDPLEVTIDYSAYQDAFGADWSKRLQIVQLSDCKSSSPESCAMSTTLETANDLGAKTLTASVEIADDSQADKSGGEGVTGDEGVEEGSPETVKPASFDAYRTRGLVSATPSSPTVMVAASAAGSGSAGDFSASPLKLASSWSAGSQSGDFSWSYPFDMIPSPGGLEPDLSLDYNSGSVDGLMSTSNNQPSWIGEGFELNPGFIERSYMPCHQVDTNYTGDDEKLDLCWNNDEISLSFGAHSGELVRDGSTHSWRLKQDDGTRVLRYADADNPIGNRDNDGEYWLVITPDGTKYYFGRSKRLDTSAPAANSVSTVPVYGAKVGDPCHSGSSWSGWVCRQAWRWSLDYVVDTNGNSMSLSYTQETNYYAGNDGAGMFSYDRAPLLDRIDYGTRKGSEGSGSAPERVTFTRGERCDDSGQATGYCSSEKILTNPGRWQDTPTDQICTSTATPSSCSKNAPTFFSRYRLQTLKTQVFEDGEYRGVKQWDLSHSFPVSGDTNDPALWLWYIEETGLIGDDIAVRGTHLLSKRMANRVDADGDGLDPFYKRRLEQIQNPYGGVTTVGYSDKDCTPTSKPSASTLESNSRRCFPAYYQKPNASSPSLEFFHKYRADYVVEDDTVGGSAAVRTNYDYKDGDGWHYADDGLTPPKYRTWNQWRGYGRVATRVGGTDSTGETFSETLYLRGMNGNKKVGGGTQSITVEDPLGYSPTITDYNSYQGFRRRVVTKLGSGNATIDRTYSSPWVSPATAENSSGDKAYIVKPEYTETTTNVYGGERTTAEFSTYNEGTGLVRRVWDKGNVDVTTDDRCTLTSYQQDIDEWMMDFPFLSTTTARACSTDAAAAPTAASQVISSDRYTYDGLAGPNQGTIYNGNITKVESAAGYNTALNTIQYQTDSTKFYDALGRIKTEKDAANKTTTTAYSPATGLVDTTTVTNPLGQQAITTSSTYSGAPTKLVDIAGARTDFTYDALGRVTAAWAPGRTKGTQSASSTFSYKLSSTNEATNPVPAAVTTDSLNPDGTGYVKTINFFDGYLRERSTQAQTATTDTRAITEKIYDSRGLLLRDVGPYAATGAPSTTLSSSALTSTALATVPTYTSLYYDAAKRPIKSDRSSMGTVKSSTTTTYNGDRVTVLPPAGGTPTTTISDARGQTTALRQYAPDPSDPTDRFGPYDSTTYAYTPAGQLKTATNAAGNVWNREYDIRGNLTKDTDPDKGGSTFTYDTLDRKVTSTDARGLTTWTGYDDLGRKTVLRDTNSSGPRRASWSYDKDPITGAGRIGALRASVRYKDDAPAYILRNTAFDAAGRVTGTNTSIEDSSDHLYKSGGYSTTTTYNVDGSVDESTLPNVTGLNSEKLSWTYDAIGRPTKLTGLGGDIVSNTTYDIAGQMTQRTLNAGGGKSVIDTRQYDPATGRLNQQTAVAGSTADGFATRLDLRYAYDKAGNIKGINDVAQGDADQTSSATWRQCFTYDYLQRLTDAWTSPTTTCSTPSTTTTDFGSLDAYYDHYEYDKSGNRTKLVAHRGSGTAKTATTTTSQYPSPTAVSSTANPGGPHALQSVARTGDGTGTEAFTYDATGNTQARDKSTGTDLSFVVSREGTLQSATNTGTAKKSEFEYDADGNRLIKRDEAANTETLYLGSTEVTWTGGTTSGKRLYSINETPIMEVGAAGASKIQIADHHNTPVVSIASSDLSATKRRMNPFGSAVAGAGWPTTRGFVNQPVDTATATTHLGAREYDADLGRFLTVDPVGDVLDPQQLNGYAYANNNPVTLADPSGLYIPCEGARCAQKGGGGVYLPKNKQWARQANTNAISQAFSRVPFFSGANKTDNDRASDVRTVVRQVVHREPGLVSKIGHSVLDVAGLVPGFGEPFDGLNAAWYAGEGDATNAALSSAALVPFLGWGAFATKLGLKGQKSAKIGDGLLAPGPYAGRSIPGDATRNFTRQQRDELNEIMAETGCHRCGAPSPGTKSGDAIPDHQPPLSQSNGPFELYPHCLACSREQGLFIANLIRRGGAQ